jgi:ABC-type phosphonate transport system ATPase subunit
MVIGIFGESCVGKSTLAELLKERIGADVYSGKDYLRLAKNEALAKKLFVKKLQEAMKGEHIIYVISEKEHLSLLPNDALRILVTADLNLIKERFAARMHGNLPAPVKMMIEKKHGIFDSEKCDFHYHSGKDNFDFASDEISDAIV